MQFGDRAHRPVPDPGAGPVTRRGVLRAASAVAVSLSGTAQAEVLDCQALLIGNGAYRRNALLSNPPRDVHLLASALTPLGVKCEVLTDLGRDAMAAAVARFLARVQARGGAAWISFSGHAVQIDGRNYLQAVDSDFSSPTDVRENGCDLEALIGQVNRARPRAAVLTVDACRNNPFKPEQTRGAGGMGGLAPVDSAGLFLGFSTAPYTRAFDGPASGASPYARALADALAIRSRNLDAVFREAADKVWLATGRQQAPEYRSSLRGEWWFNPTSMELRAAAAATAGPGLMPMTAREAGYRPDLPAQALASARRDPAEWDAEDRSLQLQSRQIDRAEARAVLVRGRAANASPRESALAGLLLEEGTAVERDRLAALRLYRRAAERGHVPGQTLLGELLCARGDFAEACKWLTAASDAGFTRARLDLAQLKLEGSGTPRDTAGAFELLRVLVPQVLPPGR